MSKKNRKNKKKKKGKESDGHGNSTGGGNKNNNNNNNNNTNNRNNNDITNPTVVDETVVATTTTTTTTVVLTQQELELITNKCNLKGYPKSNDFVIGYKYLMGKQDDSAIASFIRGAETVGCVPCMYLYVNIQSRRGNLHLVIPWALEGVIRGHTYPMDILIDCYQKKVPEIAHALVSFWAKTRTEFGDTQCTEEMRKEFKNIAATVCCVCGKEESKDNDEVTLVKCGICKHYSYCGKKCQTRHWKEAKHMNECRQVILLRKYCKPSYVKEIREAIMSGQDPKEIHTLQRLRMKLGLNRPKEDYEDLLLRLSDDNNNNNNIMMKRGTKVQLKGLVKASVHNGKLGIVTNVSIPGEAAAGGSNSRRVGVQLFDESDTVLSIKIENLEPAPTTTTNCHQNPCQSNSNSSNRPNLLEYLIARKDGTVHIGSTPNTI